MYGSSPFVSLTFCSSGLPEEIKISNILSSSVACAQGSDDNDGALKKQLLNMQVPS